MASKAKNLGLIILFVFLLFLSLESLSAHQPRLDTGTAVSIENPIIVDNPEISQAFYGQLNGEPVYYQIKSDKPFELYLNLLVPTSPGQGGELVSAKVTDSSGNVVMFLNGTNSTWNPYFEEFGGDYYLKGPEATLEIPAGTYIIEVFNSQNQGKYSLAIGKIEAFPANEAITALFTLPLLKEEFFAKPISTLFFEFVGIILALGSLTVLFSLLVKSRKSEEITKIMLKVWGIIKPVLWYGTIIATVVWFLVIYNDPLNILGVFNSLILIIILIMTWLVSSKTSKASFGKLPIISHGILIISWWIFAFLAISVI
ncbi:hypothetical protein [Methanobacterium petrolearium]|uniref:hypothetical protein n=1 Tax=Methanobacterium petrolearium TaxID=710190 RepID=UPI001AE2B617|nr:hypothetical protein [Methanobacterium petrolearium]MBP1945852.1 hypothetical protein [Methanobacterium petrolearium]BDZ69597.1 hypothetical protein GCM10025861_01140 [Methanobacterium petrolearium]